MLELAHREGHQWARPEKLAHMIRIWARASVISPGPETFAKGLDSVPGLEFSFEGC